MIKVKRSIKINAQVDKVFEYVNKPDNLVEIWPSLKQVSNVKTLPNGGHSFDWVYKMLGMRFVGYTEYIEVVPNVRTVSISTGGIESTVRFEYQSIEGGTVFTDNSELKSPIPIFRGLLDPILLSVNERESELFLANLKAKMEE